MRKLLALSTALLLTFGCSTTPTPDSSAAAPARVTPTASPAIPFDPAVRTGKLGNGLTYFIRQNGRPEKRAALRLVVNAGSVLEDDDQRGLAHFVEHMAFNGTKNFEKQELVNYLERIGMRFGPDVNAYTSFDETVYMLEVPTDDPKIMDTAFRILDDWAGAVTFDPAEVEKERGVVVEEWRLGRGASGRIRDKQVPVVFHGSKYAERLPIGEKNILETASRDTLVRFYRQWYRPELMAVVAVGDFDPAAMETRIREQFSDIPSSAAARARENFPIPPLTKTLVSIVTDTEATGSSVTVQYRRPPIEVKTVADLRKLMVDRLYDSMMNARLRELTTKPDAPFQFGFAGSGSLGRTASTYSLGAQVRDAGVEQGLAALLTEARRVRKHGFTETELTRARTDVLRAIERQWTERDKQNSSVHAGRLVNFFLEDDPVASADFLRDVYNQLIPGITLSEVNARAGQWLTEHRSILVSGPAKPEARIPDEQTVLGVFAKVDATDVTPWVDEVLDEPLVARKPARGSVVQESTIPEIGVTKWTLSNGATVILKPTTFKADEVILRGYSPGGHSLAPDADYLSAAYATPLIAEMGAGNFTRVQLEKALSGKIASARTSISELSESVTGSSSSKDIETMLQLVWLRITSPRKDEQAFQAWKTRTRGFMENQEASPSYLFSREYQKRFTNDHPRRRFATPADLDRVDPDRALAFHRERFADASDFTFFITGTFQPDQIKAHVEQWLASLPSTKRSETWRNIGITEPDGVVKFDVRKGIEPRSTVRITFHGPAPWSLEEQHLIGSLAEVLRTRLREQLREEKGGVYGVSVAGHVERRPKEDYEVVVSFSCDPARVDELVAAVFAEIEKVKQDPGADYVARVRETQTRDFEKASKENGFWSGMLEYLAVNDLDLRRVLDEPTLIALVTNDSIRDAARRFLDTDRYVLGVLYPEK